LGTEAGGDPENSLPKRLQEVAGSTKVADLRLTTSRFILELSELQEIHPKSCERARETPSMTIFFAKVLYNKAFARVTGSDHRKMKGPVDQSKNNQVKAYKGLTAECEEEAYNMLCLVAPARLRAVATVHFATALAAPADALGSGAVFDSEILVAVSRSVGEAIEPALVSMTRSWPMVSSSWLAPSNLWRSKSRSDNWKMKQRRPAGLPPAVRQRPAVRKVPNT
jgi:hypothetical protein